MQVLKENEMKLLSRKRVTLVMENKGATPSRAELIKEIAKKFKTKEDLVIIKHIYQQFGSNRTKLIVHLYEDKEKMKIFEHKDLLKKHYKKEEKQEGAEAPAEQAESAAAKKESEESEESEG